MDITNFNLEDLSCEEQKDINGGILGAIAAACAIVLAVGEIAEQAGKSLGNHVNNNN